MLARVSPQKRLCIDQAEQSRDTGEIDHFRASRQRSGRKRANRPDAFAIDDDDLIRQGLAVTRSTSLPARMAIIFYAGTDSAGPDKVPMTNAIESDIPILVVAAIMNVPVAE